MLHARDPPNRETQISQNLAVQIQIAILVGRAAREGLQARRCREPPEVLNVACYLGVPISVAQTWQGPEAATLKGT